MEFSCRKCNWNDMSVFTSSQRICSMCNICRDGVCSKCYKPDEFVNFTFLKLCTACYRQHSDTLTQSKM